jgi:hypothetical protein
MKFMILQFSDYHINIITEKEYLQQIEALTEHDGFLPFTIKAVIEAKSVDMSFEFVKLAITP